MMKSKLILGLILTFSLLLTGITTYAQDSSEMEWSIDYITTRSRAEIDNDEGNIPGWGNGQDGSWSYITGSDHFRGDARMSSITYGHYYTWTCGGSGPTITNPSVYVYLNSSSFVDPAVQYSIYAYNSGATSPIGYSLGQLDQNTAPSGWGYLGQVGYGSKKLSHVLLRITHNWTSGYAGADGIRVQ